MDSEMWKILNLIFLLAIVKESHQMVGGKPVAISDYPYTVAILISYSQKCTGAILTKNTVISTAACINPAPTVADILVIYAVTDISPAGPANPATVTEIRTNPSFKDWIYDVALLKTSDMDLTVAKTIVLVQNPYKYQWKKEGNVTGWGYESTGGIKSTLLKGATAKINGPSFCKSMDILGLVGTEGAYCAGFPKGGYGVCDGNYITN